MRLQPHVQYTAHVLAAAYQRAGKSKLLSMGNCRAWGLGAMVCQCARSHEFTHAQRSSNLRITLQYSHPRELQMVAALRHLLPELPKSDDYLRDPSSHVHRGITQAVHVAGLGCRLQKDFHN